MYIYLDAIELLVCLEKKYIYLYWKCDADLPLQLRSLMAATAPENRLSAGAHLEHIECICPVRDLLSNSEAQ